MAPERNRQQQVKVIGHNNKFVQQVSLLLAIVKQGFAEQTGHLTRLEEVPLGVGIGRNKVSGVTCVAAMRNGHNEPQWLKPTYRAFDLTQALKACSTHPGQLGDVWL